MGLDTKKLRCLILSAGAVYFFAVSSQGSVVVASNTFDSSLQGWYSSNGWASVAHQASGGNPDGWLETTWTNLASYDPLDPWASDLFVTDATNLFAGTWSTNSFFQLDFWAATNAPAAVSVAWGSTNNSRVWANTMYVDGDGMNVTNWTTLTSANLTDSSLWHPFWSQSDFVDDLASIDWIGIRITRPGSDAEIYGLDNFNLMVPEPAEVILLLVAGFSSWMSLRKKKRALDCKASG